MKSILITGVSTGIGKSSAELLCESGYHVFGSVRKIEDAEELSRRYDHRFTPLVFDVTDDDAVRKSLKTVEEKLTGPLIGLVNNAGIALGGPVLLLDTNVFRKQMEVNFLGVLSVTKTFLPLLIESSQSGESPRIINISSISGRRSYPFVAPYCASKHALESLSDSLRRELLLYGVDVILIEPGPINTPIWDKTPPPEENIFIGSDYEPALKRFYNIFIKKGREGLPPLRVAELVKKGLESTRPKSRYVITRNKFLNFILPGILPDRWFDRLVGKTLGLTGK